MASAKRYENLLLNCLNCGARGVMTLEAAEEGHARRTLVGVGGDFHTEVGRTTPDSKAIICTRCDEIYGVLPADRIS